MKQLILGVLCLLSTAQIGASLQAQAGDTLQIWVDGICGMCKDRIEEAAYQTVGVAFAEWDIPNKTLTITRSPEPFEEQELHENIAAVGHDTRRITATDEAYASLHACCKYRDEAIVQQHEGGRMKAAVDDHQEGHLHGYVYERDENDERIPLMGANVRWLGGENGAVTDAEGFFDLPASEEAQQLLVSYVGYATDTVLIDQAGTVELVLASSVNLNTVDVTRRRRSTEVSFVEPIKVQRIGEDELAKAACCNLSESFETTPSVDVGFTDAVTGTRQIQMLGLSSPYVQITRENMPDVRGLAALHGMEYTPGAWIDGIMLNMGTGSVVNGYEAIAGQINVELHKPEEGERLYLNLFANAMQRFEGNLSLRHSLSEQFHTGLMLHAKHQKGRFDRNDDGFLDMPLSEALIGVHRWRFKGKNGWMGQVGIKGTYLNSTSGQVDFRRDRSDNTDLWGATHDSRRAEAWLKMGKVFANRPYASMGLQLSGNIHHQESTFGERIYDGDQRSFYANYIYKTIITDTRHQIKMGASWQWDSYEEVFEAETFERVESVPGVFGEYTWKGVENFTAVAGLRADYHNLFGAFVTPRLHLKYKFSETAVLRGVAGRGQRTANILIEQIGAMASNRAFIIQGGDEGKPYGLDQEIAWNYGLNYAQEFTVAGRQALLSLDAYHTRFQQQVVADFDADPQALYFYNLDGESFSNSLQAQLDYELLTGFDVRLAYRFNDVRVDYREGQLRKPLIARHRAFLNTAYETENGWAFDATLNWQGPKRLPDTRSNPEGFRLEPASPSFFLLSGQVTKSWNDGQFELYVGGENLLNFRQENPILSSSDPFGPYFDASMVWGPIFGRNVYAGLRYRIP
ncbi:MAG: TonB-dependent receptor [Bacteroidetes bacterium]|jgi:outer membrane receptor for ferrienterochelin and colicin|nr:TonB-dependent receptor [Bacteroidota bacterium]